MTNPTRLTNLLGVDSPVMLGAFGGLSSVELTARVSELGGLGSYGMYGYSSARVRETAGSLRTATARPFALNLWLPFDEPGTRRVASFDAALADLSRFFVETGVEKPSPPTSYLPSFHEQFEAVLEAHPAAVSFVYGVPPTAVVEAAQREHIVVIGTATTVDEAIALEEGGVNAVVASGAEAAGHRVSFLRPPEESLVGTFALVPQVVDAVRVPVIAAGGIADRRGVAAAFALGAAGVQVGTAFLRTRQSAANDAYREAIARTVAHETVLTRAMSGRLARGIPNRAIRQIEAGAAIAAFPVQNWLTGRFRVEAGRRGIADLQSLWAGQSSALARLDDVDEVFQELMRGVPTTGE